MGRLRAASVRPPQIDNGGSAKIRCITGLQAELRNAVDSDAHGVAAVGAPVEEDLMGDAAMERGLENNPGRPKLSRQGRRELAKKKKSSAGASSGGAVPEISRDGR